MLSFKPNCTIPPDNANYVSGPNTRGTISILWNCLSIIFLCTWNILHLNIPARRPRTSSWLQKLWWTILDSRTKAWWMVITILAPEYLVGKALNDWLSARWRIAEFKEWASEHETEWELIHGYYANMGGFVLDFSDFFPHEQPRIPDTPASTNSSATPLRRISHPKMSRDFFSILVDEVRGTNGASRIDRINLERMKHWLWSLNLAQFSIARDRGLIQLPPGVSVKDLEALDKSDNLVKAISIVQVLWLIIQLVTRKIRILPVTQLEIAALAFSASSIITYSLYLGHPQGAQSVTRIKAQRLPDAQDIKTLLLFSPAYLWTGPRMRERADGWADFIPIPNDACNTPPLYWTLNLWLFASGNTETMALLFGAIFGGTVFGGVHCLAWNFHFPTELESTFWKVSSTTIASMPLISTPFNLMWLKLNGPLTGGRYDHLRPYVSLILLAGCTIPYVIARLFIMVEIFRSLLYSPPGVFIDTWSTSFPH